VTDRITQSMLSTTLLADLQTITDKLARTQGKLSSGKEIQKPSDDPFATARALAVLPPGTAVRLYTCSQGWCNVAVSQLGGYLLEEFLTSQAPQAATSQGRGYINSQGEWVPSPTRTADGKPPSGATAHCRDGTFSFSHTRQGTCSHHGGVAEWVRE